MDMLLQASDHNTDTLLTLMPDNKPTSENVLQGCKGEHVNGLSCSLCGYMKKCSAKKNTLKLIL